MLILAIDPGFDKLGYSIFEKKDPNTSDYKYITSALIRTPKSDPHEKRLEGIYDALKQLIKNYKIECLVLEQLFIFKNQKTVIQVAQAIGVIELLAAQHNLLLERLTPLEIKQIVTGYGNADKKSVQKMVELTLKEELSIVDDDQADAIACGLAYCFLNRRLM